MSVKKVCFKCGELLSLSEYYKHPGMKDGTLNKCKSCTKKDVREYEDKNSEKIREKKKAYAVRPERVKKSIEYMRKYRKMFNERYAAHRAVSNAIRDGKLLPESCSICGTDEFVEAHHEDYSKPLDVMWLCSKHHKARHKQIKKENNATN